MKSEIITLISPDKISKIVCYKYMEECFKNEGYISEKNYFTNLLYKLVSNKVFRKVIILIKLILKSKFFFKNPPKKKFLIFDCESTIDIEQILIDKDYSILSTRIHKIKEIYLSFDITRYILKNFFKRSLKQNYLIAVIKAIGAKTVITHISHSVDFHIVSKVLENDAKFIAIQSGTSNEFSFMSEKDKKRFFIPNFFCFSEYDKIFYKKRNVNIGTFVVTGSIRSSLSNEYVKSQKLKINPSKYDICLVSESHTMLYSDYPQVENLADCIGEVAQFTHELCKKHNLKLVFTGESDIGLKTSLREIYFYKHYLKNYDFKILQSSDRKRKYHSYVNIMQSKLTIGLVSTMLREAISFKKKILSCNLVEHPDVIFPMPNVGFPNESICTIKRTSFENFESKVLKILSMSDDEYFNQLGKETTLIMPTNMNANKIMKENIK